MFGRHVPRRSESCEFSLNHPDILKLRAKTRRIVCATVQVHDHFFKHCERIQASLDGFSGICRNDHDADRQAGHTDDTFRLTSPVRRRSLLALTQRGKRFTPGMDAFHPAGETSAKCEFHYMPNPTLSKDFPRRGKNHFGLEIKVFRLRKAQSCRISSHGLFSWMCSGSGAYLDGRIFERQVSDPDHSPERVS